MIMHVLKSIRTLFFDTLYQKTWDIVQYAEQTEQDWDWSYAYLSANRNITWDIVQAHSDKDWDYGVMSSNPNKVF